MNPTITIEGHAPFTAVVGATLLEACEAGGVPMESACGGFAACNSCRVVILKGADLLGPIDDEEDCFLDAPGQRLGCQITVQGPLTARLDPGC